MKRLGLYVPTQGTPWRRAIHIPHPSTSAKPPGVVLECCPRRHDLCKCSEQAFYMALLLSVPSDGDRGLDGSPHICTHRPNVSFSLFTQLAGPKKTAGDLRPRGHCPNYGQSRGGGLRRGYRGVWGVVWCPPLFASALQCVPAHDAMEIW